MKTKILLLAALLTLLSLSVVAQKVTLVPKKVVYTRPKPISSYKKRFTIVWPKVRGAKPAVAKKIEAALNYENVFDFTVADEIKDTQWLEKATYDAVFSSGKILSVNLNIEGSGGYPDQDTETIVLDSSTGVVQKPSMVFNNLEGLAAMIDKQMQSEIKQAIIDLRKDPDMKDPDPATLFEGQEFGEESLDGFAVDGKGVTFHYDYGFPHVIQAAEPSGYFFYRWDEIKRFIKPAGLLGPMAR